MRPLLLALPLSCLLTGCNLLQHNSTADGAPTQRISGWLNTSNWQLEPCAGEQSRIDLVASSDLQQQLQTHCEAQRCFVDLLTSSASLSKTAIQPGPLLRIETESAGCQTGPAGNQLVAQGNEPFWSLLISQQGMLLEQPGQPALAMPHIEEALPDGSLHYSSQANHEQLNLWISPQPCTDSMSGAYRHLTAHLEWQGQTATGCAYYAPENPNLPPVTQP